ncbi:hypothetical protein [Chamaesiphon polymorphus]|uniref:hypothetical protein n=1 Tax=Chamaesiphon polymorphus TaxID=2107691 RepID=UPI0011B27BD6|nr:hypothetical protein [Chamaesiphon polymorphus]
MHNDRMVDRMVDRMYWIDRIPIKSKICRDEFVARPRPNATIVTADITVEVQERIVKEWLNISK